MEGLDNLVLSIFAMFIATIMASLIPAIVGFVACNAEHAETFKSYFIRADAALYFTDKKIIHMRKKYTNEYRNRFRYTTYFVTFWLVCSINLHFVSQSTNHISDNTWGGLGGLMACLYIFGCSYLVGLTAASKARLEATMPLTDRQRDRIREILVNSVYSKEILQLINSNPKNQLAQIDYLYIKHAIRDLEDRDVKHMNELLAKQL
ncbi:hypothetical protein [Vibrio alginolyticus]|uniref:hypothetical protein n=1 Tax=Vibrio alginolyticus TaxID=663 RepID=UPI0015934472|nr:hypothetical protein [Vibrio alginolyticus]QKS98445.1 hypothetical protein HUO05_24905 [Vibrio alginolyticus]